MTDQQVKPCAQIRAVDDRTRRSVRATRSHTKNRLLKGVRHYHSDDAAYSEIERRDMAELPIKGRLLQPFRRSALAPLRRCKRRRRVPRTIGFETKMNTRRQTHRRDE